MLKDIECPHCGQYIEIEMSEDDYFDYIDRLFREKHYYSDLYFDCVIADLEDMITWLTNASWIVRDRLALYDEAFESFQYTYEENPYLDVNEYCATLIKEWSAL
jgi:hypothetical protein